MWYGAAAKCNLMIQIFSNLKKVRELETARMDLEKARNASQIGLFKARTRKAVCECLLTEMIGVEENSEHFNNCVSISHL